MALEDGVRQSSAAIFRGSEYDRWDLECRTGPLASARMRMAIEEHGDGKQLIRFAVWPVWSRLLAATGVALGGWLIAEIFRSPRAAVGMACITCVFLLRALHEAGTAIGLLTTNISVLAATEEPARLPVHVDQEVPTHVRNGTGASARANATERSSA
jgi:hypothetical protein